MKEDDKLIDAVLDLGLEMKGMRKAQEETNHRLEKLEKHQQRNNLALGEMRLSYMKLDESFNKYALLYFRLQRIRKSCS